jgi:hypothetical protein
VSGRRPLLGLRRATASRRLPLRRRVTLMLPLAVVSLLQVSVGEVERSVSGRVASSRPESGAARVIKLCCAWGRQLDDGKLTFAFTSGDAATVEVMRGAVGAWAAALPELTLTEIAPEERPDITITYAGVTRRTQGVAVTSFDRRGLTRKVEITIEGAPPPGNRDALDQITKHEFGHALGIGHSEFVGDLMSPAVNPAPAPIPACNLQAAREANRWKLLDHSSEPRRPARRAITCTEPLPAATP